MWRSSCVALLLPALVMLWCGCADSMPLFGFLNLLSSASSTNGTGLLETLAMSHLQHKMEALEVLGDLIAIATNLTGSGLSSLG